MTIPRQVSHKFSGFTLIELLVVTAIISLLAAILFPALKQAKDRAITIGCIANLRQIGLGGALYAADADGRLPATVRGRGNRFATEKSRFDYATWPIAARWVNVVNIGQPYFDVVNCTEIGGTTVIDSLTASGTMPATYADTLIDARYSTERIFHCPLPRQPSAYDPERVLGYSALFTLVHYDWSSYWGELTGQKLLPPDSRRRHGLCDAFSSTLIRVPEQGVWMADTSPDGMILIYPFEIYDQHVARYTHHQAGEAINLLFYDGHAQTRSKRQTPSMFRLRYAAGGGDVVDSPYVADYGAVNPDGLWRPWLRAYPAGSGDQ